MFPAIVTASLVSSSVPLKVVALFVVSSSLPLKVVASSVVKLFSLTFKVAALPVTVRRSG